MDKRENRYKLSKQTDPYIPKCNRFYHIQFYSKDNQKFFFFFLVLPLLSSSPSFGDNWKVGTSEGKNWPTKSFK